MNKLALVAEPRSWQAPPAGAQTAKYPPLSEYLMEANAEIALARSAAPDHISNPPPSRCSARAAIGRR